MGFLKKRRLGLLLALVVLLADQLTKIWAQGALFGKSQGLVDGLLELTLSFNRGVAFSFMADIPHAYLPFFLAAFAFAVSLLFIVYMPTGSRLFHGGLGCIVGGALGNMIDRLVFGSVIDFIHVYQGEWSFPVFNVADAAINVGVGLVLLDALRQSRNPAGKMQAKSRLEN